ncbi:phosphohydrolase [Deminuibacter soli]|uniref:Phosphohydrolase n=1 Tax=Deminuibacter soli TaxID=2291815 RepID=A0A3E1NHN1_9BACT|nr:phosphohydrolase [Deminuibacter soli]RFM27417.1 phosphohydrolase [Deminuibacter soli]
MDMQLLTYWQQQFISYLTTHANSDDGAHDMGHFNRVWQNCRAINQTEGNKADDLVLLTAAYFHDLVSFPKNHPDRSCSSLLSADQTAVLLKEHFTGFPADKIAAVHHAIHAHSFSAGIPTETYEAQILQDADRMEALGAIGIARTFYTAGLMHSSMFNAEDPMGENRPLNDSRYALDHFTVKLLQLPALMNTAAGKQMARANADYLVQFREKMCREITGEW